MRVIKHPQLDPPRGNSVIWRYLSVTKFLDFLAHRRLFFTNATQLSDRYEATVPERTIVTKRKQLSSDGLTGRELDEELMYFRFHFDSLRDLTLVNCWSLGRDESYALWKIYVGSGQPGAAIRTTVSKLKTAIQEGGDPYPEDLYFGRVQYTDFIPPNDLTRFRMVTTKNRFYEFESEVRLFIFHYPLSEGGTKPPYSITVGRHVSVNLSALVDQLYLSPFVGQWFQDTFAQIVKQLAPEISDRVVTSLVRDT